MRQQFAVYTFQPDTNNSCPSFMEKPPSLYSHSKISQMIIFLLNNTVLEDHLTK